MAYILSIETATHVCSVAIHQNGQLKAITELHIENSHSQKLLDIIDFTLNQVGIQAIDLNAVAVSGGPGSYTGLRIGVSIAKGLAFAGKIPLIGICTLEALGLQALPFAEPQSYILPMIDARRMEVYGMLLDNEGNVKMKVQPFLLEENPFEVLYGEGKTIYTLGDGADKASSIMNYSKLVHLPYVNSAKSVGQIAWKKFEAQQFSDIAYYEPNYLKEFRVLQSAKNPLLQ
jgi:tRNA threonylcarbamoyladenosine biosynthesis protein TsaB